MVFRSFFGEITNVLKIYAKLEKMVCFWSYDQFWKGHDEQIKEKRMQKRVFRVYFDTWKIRV